MTLALAGQDFEVSAVEGEGEVCLRVTVGFDLGWHPASTSTGFPGTAVLYDQAWYEVVERRPQVETADVTWVYDLRKWEGVSAFRDTFELHAEGVAAAREKWRNRDKPFSWQRSVLALLPALFCLLVVGTTYVALCLPVAVWTKAQIQSGGLTPLIGRLIILGILLVSTAIALWEISILNRWLAGVNRRYPWMETELWHGRNGLLGVSLLLAASGGLLVWLGQGDWRWIGGSMIVAAILSFIRTWNDHRLG